MMNWRESRGASPPALGTIAELSPEALATFSTDPPLTGITATIPKPDTSDLSLRDAHMLQQSLERHFELVADHNDLGEGSFAIVRRIRDKRNARILALKVMEKHPLLIRNMVQQVHREVKLQSACKHPNILRLFDFLEDDTHIYMLLEFAGFGVLAELMARSPGRRLTEVHGGWIFGQVVDG